MPRPLVIGNGNLLVTLDGEFSIRDLYWPYVGLHNHVSGGRCRLGVWCDGRFAWLGDPSWERTPDYRADTLVTSSIAVSRDLMLALSLEECVDHRADLLLRTIRVTDLADRQRSVRVFIAHDFVLAETDIGDTAFYNPYLDALIHYKRDTYILAAARVDGRGLYQYAAGIKGFRGAEGTWRDAEDGELGMNPVAQGSVDSVMSVRLTVPARGAAEAKAWIGVGHNLAEVTDLHLRAERGGFEGLVDDTARYWTAWSAPETERLRRLPTAVGRTFRRSLLLLRTNVDNRGAIIAANDSDIMETARAHYSYMWPRDGALVADEFSRLGLGSIVRRFMSFCKSLTPPGRPTLLHKYSADGSWGSTWHPWIVDGAPEVPFQQDSTALVLWAIGRHHGRSGDIEFTESLYDEFVRPCADFMVEFRDPTTRLPLPSYDLWEERRGVHAFTCGAVVGALESAADLANAFGDACALTYRSAADEVRRGIATHLWSEPDGRYARRLTYGPAGVERDMTVDSALHALWMFGAFAPDDPRIRTTIDTVEERLTVDTRIGGMARYESDYYFRQTDDLVRVPGNPWLICTLWMARWQIACARSTSELAAALPRILWASERALPGGAMPEQVHPYTGAPLSVAPLSWSHSEFLATVLDYLDAQDRMRTLI